MTTFERIKSVADSRGMNLREVARKSGMKSETAIYRYNQGVTPRESTLRTIADVLGVSVDYLLGNTDDTMPTQSTNGLDLREVAEEERHEGISAGGHPISDEDWAVIKVLLAKYPRNEDK
ncbi:helix-turn-helix domain-containing protein [Weissella tructae]|uniref:helix-turn-helix domain-containing protein n=1 Tax=Weissella tructae TaxID=887702 RepID=UPI001BDD502D|nr:helix-turn-helix transcriptional regulator [Weissella tructae]QVV90860.1 helix-turn-helix domain-containing protein [Weissella tructae]